MAAPPIRPDVSARPEYIAAFREIANRIASSLANLQPDALPIRMYVAGGAARLLYFDRQHNDTFGLLHEDAYDDSVPLILEGRDSKVLEIRLLSALDLAVSKLGRFSGQDREDIVTLARHNLIDPAMLKQRAEAALHAYVGDTARIRGAIDAAARVVADVKARSARSKTR
jgi:hypothetical protein